MQRIYGVSLSSMKRWDKRYNGKNGPALATLIESAKAAAMI